MPQVNSLGNDGAFVDVQNPDPELTENQFISAFRVAYGVNHQFFTAQAFTKEVALTFEGQISGILNSPKLAAIMAAVMLLSLSACGTEPAEPDQAADSEITRDYVSGYWTDGKTNHLFLQQSADGMYFMLDTTLRNDFDSSGIFLLERDSLYGVTVSEQASEKEGTDTAFEKVKVFTFHYSDDNTMKVLNTIDGSEHSFVRDTLDFDRNRLEDDYMFFNLLSTISFIQGNWEDETGDHFFCFEIEDGLPNLKTNLRMHSYDSYSFNGNIISGTKDEEEPAPIFDFTIIDADHIEIYSHAKEESYKLHREAEK